jgi:hypothetical protein
MTQPHSDKPGDRPGLVTTDSLNSIVVSFEFDGSTKTLPERLKGYKPGKGLVSQPQTHRENASPPGDSKPAE